MGCACSCMSSSNRVHPVSVASQGISPGVTKRAVQKVFAPVIQSFRNQINQRPVVQETENVPKSPDELWSIVERRCPLVKKTRMQRDRAWKTIHVYVASTFSDFHDERAILASQVFPKIARWCEGVRMQFVPIDLQWGLSREMQTAEFLLASLKEIERCTEDDMPVFFIALLSDTLGWVPTPDKVPQSILDQYNWVPGMSLLEMEIVHAAYKTNNPNAAFLFRDPSYQSDLSPEQYRNCMDPSVKDRLQLLKSKLKEKFPDQIFTYQCQVLPNVQQGCGPRLEPSTFFCRAVTEFVINRIRKEFSLEWGPRKLISVQNEQQSQELERLCSSEVLGRSNTVEKIVSYVEGTDSCSPLLLIGEVGSGKSTVIAKCAQLYLMKQQKQQQSQLQQASHKVQSLTSVKEASPEPLKLRIFSAPTTPGRRRWATKVSAQSISLQQADDTSSVESVPLREGSESPKPQEEPVDSTWHVFYHFACSIPRSAELRHILQRIWAIDHLGEPKSSPMKNEANALAKDVMEMLSKRGRKRYVLFIDGVDRIKDEYHSNILKWVPARLPGNIRIVVSLSPNSETRKILNSREPKCIEVYCGPLNLALARQLISQCLNSHGLTSTPQLNEILLSKLGVCNPQYVKGVCDELVRAGKDGDLHMIAEQFATDLGGLHDQIIDRLEDEAGGRLIIATLCLLERSHCGLLESELLDMLGALTPSGYSSDSDNPSRAVTSEASARNSARQQNVSSQYVGSPHLCERPHSYQQLYLEAQCFAPDFLGVYSQSAIPRAESSLYTGSPHTSRSQLRSQATLTDFEDFGDAESTMQQGRRASSQFHDVHKSSPAHSLVLPGAVWGTSDDGKLSPKIVKRQGFRHSAHELLANPSPILPSSVSPEGSPSMANQRKPHKLPSSPSLSLLSAELAQEVRKSSSASQISQTDGPAETEVHEIGPATSSDQPNSNQTPFRVKRMVGLDRMNVIHMASATVAPKLPAYLWAHMFHRLRPFLRNVGWAGECRWALATKAFSRSIRKKYFKQPPTQSFPFSFCTSSAFYGADKDQNLHSLMSHRTTNVPGVVHTLIPSPVGLGVGVGTSRAGSSMQGDLVHKRFDWWHARLAGYFSISNNEDRRAEELPYHLARLQDYGRLSHSLVHFPMFERLSDPENVMDLLRFWRCAGGYSNAVSMYQRALDELEISGASSQEMVSHMQKVALFLHKAGETEAAQQMLVDAIELEETRLGGRPESMASLTLKMTEILSQSSRQHAQYLEPKQSLEPEYKLLQFASRSVEFHRSLHGAEVERSLALLLMLLSIHLLHYASLGGSITLSARHALEEAQDTAQEAAELYTKLEDYGHLLEVYLHLATTYDSTPRRALEILKDAQRICRTHFGELNGVMLRILLSIALMYECRFSLYDSAETYYKKWAELTLAVYGDDHSSTTLAREHVADFLAGRGLNEEALAYRRQ